MPLQRLLTNTTEQLEKISRDLNVRDKMTETFRKYYDPDYVNRFFNDKLKEHSEDFVDDFASSHDDRYLNIVHTYTSMSQLWQCWYNNRIIIEKISAPFGRISSTRDAIKFFTGMVNIGKNMETMEAFAKYHDADHIDYLWENIWPAPDMLEMFNAWDRKGRPVVHN
jgi:hypothetical protein